jgi:hypothetical protein
MAPIEELKKSRESGPRTVSNADLSMCSRGQHTQTTNQPIKEEATPLWAFDPSASSLPLSGKVFAYECHVHVGSMDQTSGAASAMNVAAPRTVFEGECYLCVDEGHSQNYCPLSRCHTCHRYGHTERACCFAARPWGLYTTEAAAQSAMAAPTRRWTYNKRSSAFSMGQRRGAPPCARWR